LEPGREPKAFHSTAQALGLSARIGQSWLGGDVRLMGAQPVNPRRDGGDAPSETAEKRGCKPNSSARPRALEESGRMQCQLPMLAVLASPMLGAIPQKPLEQIPRQPHLSVRSQNRRFWAQPQEVMA